jgi:hypothetical protein
MPKDEWKRANAKVARQRRQSRSRHSGRPSKDALAASRDPDRIVRAIHWGTVLWFGRYKGTKLENTPLGYLKWLANACGDASSPSIQALIHWVRMNMTTTRIRRGR